MLNPNPISNPNSNPTPRHSLKTEPPLNLSMVDALLGSETSSKY